MEYLKGIYIMSLILYFFTSDTLGLNSHVFLLEMAKLMIISINIIIFIIFLCKVNSFSFSYTRIFLFLLGIVGAFFIVPLGDIGGIQASIYLFFIFLTDYLLDIIDMVLNTDELSEVDTNLDDVEPEEDSDKVKDKKRNRDAESSDDSEEENRTRKKGKQKAEPEDLTSGEEKANLDEREDFDPDRSNFEGDDDETRRRKKGKQKAEPEDLSSSEDESWYVDNSEEEDDDETYLAESEKRKEELINSLYGASNAEKQRILSEINALNNLIKDININR